MPSADWSTLAWAHWYRGRAYNPLPSKGKVPLVRPSRYRDRFLPRREYERFDWSAIQIPCGPANDLYVLDVENGSEDLLRSVLAGRHLPETWRARSGGGGLHFWFRSPEPGFHGFSYRRLAGVPLRDAGRGHRGWAAGIGVELLGSGRLITAPPSLHRKGGRYAWEVGPDDLPYPAALPAWLLEIPEAMLYPDPGEKPTFRPPVRAREKGLFKHSFSRRVVLDAIPDKIGLLVSYGLRLAGHIDGKRWVSCHSILRVDRTPSAMVAADSGRYWEVDLTHPRAYNGTLGFFEVLAAMGCFADWREACDYLGTLWVGNPSQPR